MRQRTTGLDTKIGLVYTVRVSCTLHVLSKQPQTPRQGEIPGRGFCFGTSLDAVSPQSSCWVSCGKPLAGSSRRGVAAS